MARRLSVSSPRPSFAPSAPVTRPHGNGARPVSFFQACSWRRRRKEQVAQFDDIRKQQQQQQQLQPLSRSDQGSASPDSVPEDGDGASVDSAAAEVMQSSAWELAVLKSQMEALRLLNLGWVEGLWASFKTESLRAGSAASRADRSVWRNVSISHASFEKQMSVSSAGASPSHTSYGGHSDHVDRGLLTLSEFLALAQRQTPRQDSAGLNLLECLFDRVDLPKTGMVKARDLATMLVLICEEDTVSKLHALFRIFDNDDDSCLQVDEIFDMYVSIKTNDISRHRRTVEADVTFEGELSLQEAKRLYELTIQHLDTDSDYLVFEEFLQAFNRCPFLLESLMPGTFSLQWIFGNESLPKQDALSSARHKSFTAALRKGDEQLDMSRKRGLGRRILQKCLGMTPIPAAPEQEKISGHRHCRTAKASGSTTKRAASGGPGGRTDVGAQRPQSAAAAHGRAASRRVVPRRHGSPATAAPPPGKNLKAGLASPNCKVDDVPRKTEAPGDGPSDCEASRVTKASSNDQPDDDMTEAPEVGDGENLSSTGSLTDDDDGLDPAAAAAWGVSHKSGASAAKAIVPLTFEVGQVERMSLLRFDDEKAIRKSRIAAAAVSKQDQVNARRAASILHDRKYHCYLCGMHHELKDQRLMHGRTGIMYLPAWLDSTAAPSTLVHQ